MKFRQIPAPILRMLFKYLPVMVEYLSPTIRSFMVEAIKELEKRADATENLLDDVLVDLLKLAFDVD